MKPLDSGRSARKFRAICDQEHYGMASSMSLPVGEWHGTLAWAQVEQDAINLFMSVNIDGHQYFLQINLSICLDPG